MLTGLWNGLSDTPDISTVPRLQSVNILLTMTVTLH